VIHHDAPTTAQMRRDLENLRNMLERARQTGGTVHGFNVGELQRMAGRAERQLVAATVRLN
jgi:hypothetical protein